MQKYESICELIEKRIRHGDYALKDIPPEERLASEVGVSRMTARRAVMQLIERGVLLKQPNGRVAVNRELIGGAGRAQLAMLTPAWVTSYWEKWRTSAERVADKMNAGLRKVDFVHWDDPVISETLDRCDGALLIPSPLEIPKRVLNRLQDPRTPLVVLDADWSSQGLRSIVLTPPSHIRHLLQHLYDQGHREIACLNTQPQDAVVQARINEWQAWCKEKGLSGRLIHEPCKAYEDSMARAHEVMTKFLQVRKPDFTAILAIANVVGIGAMRALHDAGIKIGQEISVCAVNDDGIGRYMHPTMTATQMPDPEPYLEVALEWMLGRNAGWTGPLLLEANKVQLYVGESTGECIRPGGALPVKPGESLTAGR